MFVENFGTGLEGANRS